MELLLELFLKATSESATKMLHPKSEAFWIRPNKLSVFLFFVNLFILSLLKYQFVFRVLQTAFYFSILITKTSELFYKVLINSLKSVIIFGSAFPATAMISAMSTGARLSGSHSSVSTETAIHGKLR